MVNIYVLRDSREEFSGSGVDFSDGDFMGSCWGGGVWAVVGRLLISSYILFSTAFMIRTRGPGLNISPVRSIVGTVALSRGVRLIMNSANGCRDRVRTAVNGRNRLMRNTTNRIGNVRHLNVPTAIMTSNPTNLHVSPGHGGASGAFCYARFPITAIVDSA